MAASNEESIGLWSAVSIGVGGMVGGGIFAVLGLAVSLARGGTPVAFALAGLIALITAYSYARLSVAYPCRGGTVEFLNQGFGPGTMTGGLNILLWLSYVVMLSLYAYAFGSYGAAFFADGVQSIWKHVLITAVILLLTALNVLSARIIGESEELIVGFLTILGLFIGFGLRGVDLQQLRPATWSPPLEVIAGGMIIFLAYEGFELIANTAGEVKNPAKTLPRAYFISVGFVILLYVLITVVVLGNLPVDQIVAARDYALAMAARPFLGSLGFTLIVVAALLSTASAINATLYGASRVSYIIAKEGELPEVLDKKIWNRPLEGLFITSGLSLLVANLFDLSSISIMGSAGFLIIFAAVNWANIRLYKKTGACRSIPAAGFIGCLFALGALVWQTAMQSPQNLLVLGVLVGAAFATEVAYQMASGRELRPFFETE
ncbi:MAG: amino acid permease [Euryarchaeota archaeon]|nr:amino acid permease [Euryarchaeota archaeon]